MRYELFLYGYGVAFVTGIGCYFGLNEEPSLSLISGVCLFFLVLWGLVRRHLYGRLCIGILTCFMLGMWLTSIRSHYVSAPVLNEMIYDTVVSGKVVSVSKAPDKQRILLKDLSILGVPSDQTPKFVRLTADFEFPKITLGDQIEVTTSLWPPSLPAVFGGYDFARQLWFEQIGATGRIAQVRNIISRPENTLFSKIEDIRQFISLRLQEVLSYNQAQVAIPLVIGDQQVVSQEMYDLFRFSGIAHVLSVSGFHLSLVGGGIFFLIRLLLAFFPRLNGRINTKKVAVVGALIVAFLYLVLSGVQIPAVRAFIMLSLVLIAVFFDRNPFSARFAMIAGILMLVARPELLLNIGFQLSFMAVFALVTLFEPLFQRFKSNDGFLKSFKNIIITLILVDVLATLSTVPLIIYHFNQVVPYSILGNLATTFLFSFFVLPLLMAGLIIMPFGGEELFFASAGYGIDYIISVCRFICDLPGAMIGVPSFNTSVLILMITGIFLILTRTRFAYIGACIICIGGIFAFLSPKPDVILSHRLAGYRDESGKLVVLAPRAFEYPMKAGVWLRRDGQFPDYMRVPDVDRLPDQLHVRGITVALSDKKCHDVDVSLVPSFDEGKTCDGLIITDADLKEQGTYSLYKKQTHIHIKTARDFVGKRLWSPSL